jgi:uncharacterized coiled-coil DUF342 family protein
MKFTPRAVTVADMPAYYAELCAQRDAVNAANAPHEAELDQVNAQINALQERAMSVAAAIDAARGGANWLALKREIATLAKALSGRRPS